MDDEYDFDDDFEEDMDDDEFDDDFDDDLEDDLQDEGNDISDLDIITAGEFDGTTDAENGTEPGLPGVCYGGSIDLYSLTDRQRTLYDESYDSAIININGI